MIPEISEAFDAWVDGVVSKHGASTAAAYNFNLYEHDHSFAVQLIGASRFSPTDPSWAGDEVFSSGENLFELPHAVVGDQWQSGLEAAKALILSYLQHGAQADRLRRVAGIGVGFVDGEVEILLHRGDV